MKNIEKVIDKLIDKVLNEELSKKITSATEKVISEKKDEKWIQDIDMKEGAFTKYCGGKVSCECVAKAKKEGGKAAKMANLYLNMNEDKCKSLRETIEEVDEMEDFYKKAKERKESRNMRDEFDGRDSEVIGVYSNIKKQRNEEELGEGNAFSEARCQAICSGDKSFEVDGKEYNVTDADMNDKKSCGCKSVKESKKNIRLTESELVELIERIVNEEKVVTQNILNKNLKASEDENNQNLKDVKKKMDDYMKDMGQPYEPESKKFPSGNKIMSRQAEDNKTVKDGKKKEYTPSEAVEEYIDQIARSGGMENLDYDQIKPNEEWLEMNIEGSSKTGNSQEYANAVPTDVNKGVNRRRKMNILAKLKRDSYQKSSQPVYDMAGENTHMEKMLGLDESISEKNKTKISEEIDMMKKFIGYNSRTQ
jgi:predicted DNA-binding protein